MTKDFESAADYESHDHFHYSHYGTSESDQYIEYYPYAETQPASARSGQHVWGEGYEPTDLQEDSRSKPFLSRMLNGMGVSTSAGIDWVFDWLQVLLIAGILAWITMSYGMVRMRVPTGSMIPTIEIGDSFFVDKFSYEIGLNEPEPGDIVVFWHTESRRCREHQFLFWEWGDRVPCRERYVKRLIAIGPSQVTIRQGDLYVDGQRLINPAFDRDYVCNNADHRTPELRSAEGCTHIVPEGEFFVMGDNTRNSSDSRYWGTVNPNDFIGEPFFRVWPADRMGPMNQYFGSNP